MATFLYKKTISAKCLVDKSHVYKPRTAQKPVGNDSGYIPQDRPKITFEPWADDHTMVCSVWWNMNIQIWLNCGSCWHERVKQTVQLIWKIVLKNSCVVSDKYNQLSFKKRNVSLDFICKKSLIYKQRDKQEWNNK